MKTRSIMGVMIYGSILLTSCSTNHSDKQQENRVTWFSLPSDNLERTIKFYQDAFNWQIEPLTKEENPVFDYYTALNSPSDKNYDALERGSINGCIVKREIGLPTPAVLIEVDNLDETIAKVKKAGGEVVSEKIKMTSLNAWIVFIKDTEGNYVELFERL